MATKFSVGIFFKNPLGVVGNLSEKVPFLTKTLASLVYMTDGTDVETLLNNKVDQVQGKGLSTNDYTTDEKTKLSNIKALAVKGDKETTYREGNVNLTPANIGAYSKDEIDSKLNGVSFHVVDGILQITYDE